MSAPVVTAGKFMPTSEPERVQQQLQRFTKIGARFESLLSRYLKDRASGWVRLNLKMVKGEIAISQITTDEDLDLDG